MPHDESTIRRWLTVLQSCGLANAPTFAGTAAEKREQFAGLVTAYGFGLDDLPKELVERTISAWIQGDNAFWPRPGELRQMALRLWLGIVPAEAAWADVRQKTQSLGRDGRPVWATKVLEDTVNALGWEKLCICDDHDLGTMRAHFRNTYDAMTLTLLQEADIAALAEHTPERRAGRQAALDELRRPIPMPGAERLRALPQAAPKGNETYSTMMARRRWQQAHPGKPLPDERTSAQTLAALKASPEWHTLSETVQKSLEKRYEGKALSAHSREETA